MMRNDARGDHAGKNPFNALGLHPALASGDDVRAAFRRLALSRHPDKSKSEAVDFDFAALVDARDRALAVVDARPSPAQWAVWVACTVLGETVARPIDVDLDVTLDDLHGARVKKVVLGVIRVAPTGVAPFSRQRQALFVRLVSPSRETPIGTLFFRGCGDDAPAAVLLGCGDGPLSATGPPNERGDVRVHVRVLEHPTWAPDPVLFPGSDLHATVAVSLRAAYLGERVRVPHPSSPGAFVEAE